VQSPLRSRATLGWSLPRASSSIVSARRKQVNASACFLLVMLCVVTLAKGHRMVRGPLAFHGPRHPITLDAAHTGLCPGWGLGRKGTRLSRSWAVHEKRGIEQAYQRLKEGQCHLGIAQHSDPIVNRVVIAGRQ
jgi:hypothetical protein